MAGMSAEHKNQPVSDDSAEPIDATVSGSPALDAEATRTLGETSANPTLAIPQRVGHVDIHRQIGRGGMGVVHLGRDRLLGRDVAVKFLLNVMAGQDDPRFEEFLAGARKAASLRHSHLVSIYHAGLVENVPCLVMEYVAGPTLRQVIRHCARLTPGRTIRVMLEITSAVAELHSNEIIHRDLKPGNILFDRVGRPFVTDFGLACDRPRLDDRGSSQQRIAGTPAYMAPEMFDSVISPRTDVYALGVIMFEVLAGRPPFEGTVAELRRAHERGNFPIQVLSALEVPAGVIEIIERATHKKDVFRFKTAAQLHRAIRACGVEPCNDVELQAIVQTGESPGVQRSESSKTPSSGSSYFSMLTERAAQKFGARRDDGTREAASEDPPPGMDRVLTNCACIGCGYNLRGLTRDGCCPECETDVEQSLRGNELEKVPVLRLKSVAGALRFLQAGSIALAFVVAVAALASALSATGALVPAPTWLFESASLGLVFLAAGTLFAGGARLARERPDKPRNGGTDQPAREPSHYAAIAALGLGATAFALIAVAPMAGVLSRRLAELAALAALAINVRHLPGLALRIPKASFAFRCRLCFASMLILALSWSALNAIAALRDSMNLLPMTWLSAIQCAVGVALAGCVLIATGVVSQMRQIILRSLARRDENSG